MRQQAAARWAMSQIEIQTDTPQKFTEQNDLAQMESWLDDELQCESPHTCVWGDDGGCSVEVTHRIVRDCGVAQLVCENRAAYFEKMNPVWRANGSKCFYCRSSGCFTQIIPI